MDMRILRDDEGREEFRRLMADYVDHEVVEGLSVTGADPTIPTLIVPRPARLTKEFEWQAQEFALGLHSVIRLILRSPETCMSIPLCLVNPRGRDLAKLFADTTKEEGGKYNSRPARMNLLLRHGKTLDLVRGPVTFALPGASMLLVTTWLMPGQDAIDRYSDPVCPWCGPGRTPPVWQRSRP